MAYTVGPLRIEVPEYMSADTVKFALTGGIGALTSAVMGQAVANMLNVTGKVATFVRALTGGVVLPVLALYFTRGYPANIRMLASGFAFGSLIYTTADTLQELLKIKPSQVSEKIVKTIKGLTGSKQITQTVAQPQTSAVIEVPATEAQTEAEVIEVPVEQAQPRLNIGYNIE